MSFSIARIKQWLGYENVTNTDLNNEFNNIISKAGSDTLSSANSTNGSAPTVAAMQTTSNPGGVGSESLATTTQQDVQQLRFLLQEITGGAQWYSAPNLNLSQLSGIASVPGSRIISGRVATANNQPMFLVPDGTAATVYLKAASTNFSAYFNSVLQTFSADVTLSGLTTAPASSNTCTVNDASLSGGASTKLQGENGTSITVSSLGTNITTLDGKFAAFKHSTEYFIAQIENGTVTYATPTATTGIAISGTTANTSTTLSGLSSTVGLYVGMSVTGTNIPASTTISGIGSTTVVLSNAATGSATNTMTFLGTQLTSVSSLSGLSVGMSVSGTGIAANSIVTAISSDPINGNTITLSNATTAAGSSITCTFTWLRLKNAFRGVGFDSTDSWLARTAVSNSDTITLMKLAWLFATYNSSTPGLTPVYNIPTVSYASPTSPATGDYWYDLTNSTWKTWSGSAWTSQVAVFVGISIQDTTGCKAARSTDFFKFYSNANTLEPQAKDLTNLYVPSISSKVSVYGTQYYFDKTQPLWNTTANLDSGISLSSSTTYYCYVTDLGDLKLSTIAPTPRKYDLLGAYHPAKPWRCIADVGTDGSSNILPASVNYYSYHERVSPTSGNTIYAPNTIPGGALQSGTVTSTQIANSAVGVTQRALPGQQASSSSASFTTTSTSYVNVTNLSVTITTHGHPVMLLVQGDTSGNGGLVNVQGTAGGFAIFQITRDGFTITQTECGATVVGSASSVGSDFPGFFYLDYTVSTGTHTYVLQVKSSSGTITTSVTNLVLIAYEL